MLGSPQIILPPSKLQWLATQPESVMSVSQYFADIQLDRGLGDKMILIDHLHEKVIRSDLTRALSWTMNPVADEVRAALQDLIGDGTEWKDVKLLDSMKTVFARTSSRVFAGLPLSKHMC